MKNCKRLFFIAASLTVIMLTGCIEHKPAPPVKNIILEKIQKSASGIHIELAKFTRIQQITHLQTREESQVLIAPTTGPLSQKITLRWTGPLEEVAKMISEMIEYDFETVGRRPTRDRIVTINVFESPAFDVLQDIGWQAGENIGVHVDEKTATLKLAYVGK